MHLMAVYVVGTVHWIQWYRTEVWCISVQTVQLEGVSFLPSLILTHCKIPTPKTGYLGNKHYCQQTVLFCNGITEQLRIRLCGRLFESLKASNYTGSKLQRSLIPTKHFSIQNKFPFSHVPEVRTDQALQTTHTHTHTQSLSCHCKADTTDLLVRISLKNYVLAIIYRFYVKFVRYNLEVSHHRYFGNRLTIPLLSFYKRNVIYFI